MNNSFSVTSNPSFALPRSPASQRTDGPSSGQRLPDYLLKPDKDIVSKLFNDPLHTKTGYRGEGRAYDKNTARQLRQIMQLGVAGTKDEERVMGWMRNGVRMTKRAIAMVKENHPKALRLLNTYLGDASHGTRSKFLDYAEKAIAVMEMHIEQRGAQVGIHSDFMYKALAYVGYVLNPVYIYQGLFKAEPDDLQMARIMVHEATHFAGAKDHAYIDHVGINGPMNKLHNADSLAYLIQELAYHHPVKDIKFWHDKFVKPWQPDQTFLSGDIVTHEGKRYLNTGINRNMPPNSPHWQHLWDLLDIFDGAEVIAPTKTQPVNKLTKPTPEIPVVPLVPSQPIPPGQTSLSWQADKPYNTGDVVIYEGKRYESTWISWGMPPNNPRWQHLWKLLES